MVVASAAGCKLLLSVGRHIDINAATLSLTDGAQLITETDTNGQGNAGTIKVNAVLMSHFWQF
jgi:hypothetical protein